MRHSVVASLTMHSVSVSLHVAVFMFKLFNVLIIQITWVKFLGNKINCLWLSTEHDADFFFENRMYISSRNKSLNAEHMVNSNTPRAAHLF